MTTPAQPKDSQGSSQKANHEPASDTDNKQPLPLPLPERSSDSNTTTIDMSTGGSSVKLDHLGPLVVNKDGTLSRISNWEQMAEIERQNTLRVLGKRNQLRREGLKKVKGGGEK
ncbi:hypothetical protein EJ02DRAFT_450188 [Clathrospora elynae]|uniref:Uncharacterized protein n=1 Tax=Clathrospora elynae TaxID=706981 RepID=A0A6A5T4M3_9PLEO|nr:hypothetical protein EJ02DRAFT_450188 [Clathrospora elynae]